MGLTALPSTGGRQLEAGVGEVEGVEDLVVVVAGRGVVGAGEGAGVRAFEVNESPAVLIEVGMVLGVVEAVFVVRDDFYSVLPGAERRGGFREPDLAQK